MISAEGRERSSGNSPKAIIEAALFLSSESVSRGELLDLTGLNRGQLERVLEDLSKDLEANDRGLELFESQGSYRLKVKRDILDRVKHLAPHQDMSRGVLRTLSVIAYNSPVLQKEVVDIRGNGAYDHIDKLREKNFVKSEQEGRTKLLSVTQTFLDYFELDSLEDLRKRENAPEEFSS